MTEIEQWLRDAMHAAVDDEQPPPNLLEAVRARYRRRRTRTAVAGAAAVVAGALALPPAANALRGGTEPGPQPASGTALAPRAAPGTVLTTCASEIGMPLGLGWRASSIQAGPFWFVNLQQATATYYGQSDIAISGLAVSVRNGVTASVSVVGSAVGHFRFLFRPHDFSQGVDGRYTMKSGENGVTFAGCTPESARPGESFSYQPGYTQFSGYYIVDKVPRRVSLEIRSPALSQPLRITFLVGY